MPNTLRLNEKDIKSLIISKVFISESKDKWIFDFRKVLLNSQFLSSISTIFFDQIRKDFKLVQVCGLEVAAVPLLGGILMKSFEEHFEMSGFFGAEFFIPGIDSLGINFQAGIGITSLSTGVRFRTIGETPLKAGMYFYF